jgi:hypothetical protein
MSGHRLAVEAWRQASEMQQNHPVWLGAAIPSPWFRPIVDSPFLPSIQKQGNFSSKCLNRIPAFEPERL